MLNGMHVILIKPHPYCACPVMVHLRQHQLAQCRIVQSFCQSTIDSMPSSSEIVALSRLYMRTSWKLGAPLKEDPQRSFSRFYDSFRSSQPGYEVVPRVDLEAVVETWGAEALSTRMEGHLNAFRLSVSFTLSKPMLCGFWASRAPEKPLQ